MIRTNQKTCPNCNGPLKYYDTVKRIVKTRYNQASYIYIHRYKCVKCNKLHRELPSNLLPYKHYEREVIFGVIEGLIDSNTLGFEDNPCDATMKRWKQNPPKLF